MRGYTLYLSYVTRKQSYNIVHQNKDMSYTPGMYVVYYSILSHTCVTCTLYVSQEVRNLFFIMY